MSRTLSTGVFLGLALGLLLSQLGAADPPDTSAATSTEPATQPTTAASTDQLIEQLDDDDPQVRERAGKALWAMGRPAEPALRKAAASRAPEVSRRAKAILREFAYGLYPDAPREIFSFLQEYRTGTGEQRMAAVQGLAASGIPGLRVLMKLRQDERDANLKESISQVLAPREHDVAVLLLADGRASDVEEMLEGSAPASEGAAQDYAALLYLNGKVEPALAKLKAEPITAKNAPLLLALARAADDKPTALAAAEATGKPELIESILVEQGDWKSLAARLEKQPADPQQPAVERLGYLCAYYRLAGDQARYDQTADKLIQHSKTSPQDYSACAKDLFLNDRPEEATKVLMDHNDCLAASSFLTSRLQFPEALVLPHQAEMIQPLEVPKIMARTAAALNFIGRTDDARKMLAEAAIESRGRGEAAVWIALWEAAREMNLTAQADEYAARAIEKTNGPELPMVFRKLRLGEGTDSGQWWVFLRLHFEKETSAQLLERLRSLFDRTISRKDMEELAEAARRYAADLQAASREAWQITVADTLAANSFPDLASSWVTRIEESSSPENLIHAGDFRAAQKDWPAAIHDYTRAWDLDHTQASALFLRGWALAQSGSESEGKPLMELAHRLPLGDDTARSQLILTLSRHKLTQDEHREFNLLFRTTALRSNAENSTLLNFALEVADSDQILAADLWQRAFLHFFNYDAYFDDPWADVIVPSLTHKYRGMGLIKSGRVEDGIKEINIALTETPADADALIDAVNAIDKSGHAADAQDMYTRQTSLYRKLITDYPNSGPLHNQLAWSQVECHRDLDDALKNAQRAVELEPQSTASIDTLAEVYFAKDDRENAIKQMEKCVELEPKVERHRKQLERFRHGKPGDPLPDR
jgi:hypothetical protein